MWELKLVVIAKGLAEVVGYTLIGQGVLFLFAGASRQRNFAYQLLAAVTNPIFKAVRWITPRFVADRHLGLVAFFLVFWIWLALAIAKRYLCVTNGLDCAV